jgi:hypothetical protein
VLLLALRSPAARRRLPLLLAALVLGEAAVASRFAVHAGAPDARDRAPLRRQAGLGEQVRLVHPVPVPRGYGPGELDESDRLALVESAMGMPSYNVAAGLGTFDGYTGLLPRRYKRLDLALGDAFGEYRFVAMRRFAVTHAVLPGEPDPAFAGRVRIALDGARPLPPSSPWLTAWEVPHRPWASFAPATLPVPTEEAALRETLRVLATGGPEVIVEGTAPRTPAAGRVLRVERGAEWLRIEAESEGDALLVVNDACWPGWQARVDGQPAEILCADSAVRAIPWPGGRHTMEMRYEPPEVRIGLAVSLLGSLGTVAAAAAGRRRRRQGGSGGHGGWEDA